MCGIRESRSGIRKKIIPGPYLGSRTLEVKKHWIPDPGSATLYLIALNLVNLSNQLDVLVFDFIFALIRMPIYTADFSD
jgi:hypothetical protein